jgi:transcriptional regulator of nitric oxide reductase
MWVVVIGQVELIVRVCCRTVWETNMRLMFVQWLVVRGAVPTHRLQKRYLCLHAAKRVNEVRGFVGQVPKT